MKSIKKIILGLAVFAAALGFVACKQETEPQKDLVTTKPDDSQTSAPSNDSQTSAIVVYEYKEENAVDDFNFTALYTLEFFADKKINANLYVKADGKTLQERLIQGTYEGTLTENGTVEFSPTKFLANDIPTKEAFCNPNEWHKYNLVEISQEDFENWMQDVQENGGLKFEIFDSGNKLKVNDGANFTFTRSKLSASQ